MKRTNSLAVDFFPKSSKGSAPVLFLPLVARELERTS